MNGPRVAGEPGSSRVRSGLTICQLLPPSRVAKSTFDPRYSTCGSAAEKINGAVRLNRYSPVRRTTGETSRVWPVLRSNTVTLPP